MNPLITQNDENVLETIELKYQKYLVKVCMIVGLPVLGFFSTYDFIVGRYFVGLVLFLMFAIIIGLFFLIRKQVYKAKEHHLYQYFFNILFFLFGLYLIYSIGNEGNLSRLPWAFLFAVLIFFALGEKRALIWVSLLFLVLLIFGLFFPPTEYIIIDDLKLRFYISFILVNVASFFFERLKRKYQLELFDSQRILKDSENRYREAYDKLNNEMKERKRAEEALRESEERFRKLAELMPETIYEMDLKGNLTFVNRKAYDHFGYTQADFKRGLNSFDMIVPEDRDRAIETVRRILKGEKTGLNEYTALRKDGSEFPIMSHSAPIIRNGKLVGLRGFIIDLTDRKRSEEERNKLEAQFQQAQRLETIGTLAGGIAHDFNNLLMTIQGNTSLILFDVDSLHPHYEPLKNIEKQIERGAKLTKQLLGYARKGKYNVKPIDLNQIVKESAYTFGRTRKEITIHQDLESDLYSIEADQGQIEQILYNLYVNAADAMPSGGELKLKTSNVTHHDIKSEQYDPTPGDYVRLTVTDTGVGIDQEIQKRIFDPFFTTKELGRGTGLGLASVYGIIKSHDGYIEVKSDKGSGATFSIYLPGSKKEVVKPAESMTKIIAGSGVVLLVDDEEVVLGVGIKVLEKMGYTVMGAQSGRQAIDIFKENKETIDLVILDMIMPDMMGAETYDRLKEINPHIKVLLSSGYSINGHATEIMERGCDGFIQKPFNAKKLSEKLKEILTN